ncbi:MAG: hypothetical protein AAF447_02055, partial [Myxococcota bacterium]
GGAGGRGWTAGTYDGADGGRGGNGGRGGDGGGGAGGPSAGLLLFDEGVVDTITDSTVETGTPGSGAGPVPGADGFRYCVFVAPGSSSEVRMGSEDFRCDPGESVPTPRFNP